MLSETKNEISANESNPTFTLLRLPRLLKMIDGSRSWVYQEISEGRFPKPISLGKRNVAWVEQEVRDWIKDRIEKSRAAKGKSHGK